MKKLLFPIDACGFVPNSHKKSWMVSITYVICKCFIGNRNHPKMQNNKHDISVRKLPHSTSAVYCLRNGNSGSFDSLINYDTTTKTDILELKTTLFNIKTKRTFEQFCSKAYIDSKKNPIETFQF